jgi:hypothetical protein
MNKEKVLDKIDELEYKCRKYKFTLSKIDDPEKLKKEAMDAVKDLGYLIYTIEVM